MDIREQYRERAIQFASEWGYNEVSDHILDIMVSIMATRDKSSYAGGSFVESVVNNDLFGCITRADNECLKHLKLLVVCKANCYL
jgi:hypothetical protein